MDSLGGATCNERRSSSGVRTASDSSSPLLGSLAGTPSISDRSSAASSSLPSSSSSPSPPSHNRRGSICMYEDRPSGVMGDAGFKDSEVDRAFLTFSSLCVRRRRIVTTSGSAGFPSGPSLFLSGANRYKHMTRTSRKVVFEVLTYRHYHSAAPSIPFDVSSVTLVQTCFDLPCS